AIRVICMSTNEIREFVHLGFRQGHMGRSGRGHGYYSYVMGCTGEAGERVANFSLFLVSVAIRVICMSTNEIREFVHLGFGQGHMGRSGRGHGYYSYVMGCTGEAGERVVSFGRKVR
nr:hypothetical protein [Tanacetum cinerariifolium]